METKTVSHLIVMLKNRMTAATMVSLDYEALMQSVIDLNPFSDFSNVRF